VAIPKSNVFFRTPTIRNKFKGILNRSLRSLRTLTKISGIKTNLTLSPDVPSSLLGNLVSYWKLDTGLPSNSPDEVGGTPVAGGLEVSNVAGKIGNAGRIQPSGSGTSSCLTGVTALHEFSAGIFTINQWFKMTSDPGLDVNLISRSNSVIPPGDNQGYTVSITATTRKMFMSVGKTLDIFISSAQTVGLNLGQWYMYSAIWNLPANLMTLKVFDESSLLDTVTGVAGVADYNFTPGVGLMIATSRFSSGFIYLFDETGVWNKALSDSEVLSLWNNGLGRTYPFS